MTNTLKSLLAAALGASMLLGAPAAFAKTAAPAAGAAAVTASAAPTTKSKKAKSGRVLPMRDAKGRFISKKQAAKLSKAKGHNKLGKTLPARDAKGRFISKKKAAAPAASAAPSK